MFTFYKYHGAGNDFIIIHNSSLDFNDNPDYIRTLCQRRTGIGADGLILINPTQKQGVDFKMRYFNADGYEGSMCGNGGRCALAFAHKRGVVKEKGVFMGMDGIHKGFIIKELENGVEVSLHMIDVADIVAFEDGYFLNTGSPHVVKFVDDIHRLDVISEGKRIRHHSNFPQGSNVNFVEIKEDYIFVRTFERGVEDETLSCGTGVTAASLAYSLLHPCLDVKVKTRGGHFKVSFLKDNNNFKNIMLEGPVCFVFEGIINI
ncbi:MAG: diaminopimelate epimerase [Bacteroidales bacterium]|nr:diaminopimelate epimerase [Bacteroidales bacterium]MDD4208727.1 diaminopimelate epimerase [Bacteroidales bacterium]